MNHKSAKGAAHTARETKTSFAPHSVLRGFAKRAALLISVGAICWAQEPDHAAAYYQYTLARHFANMAVDSPTGGGDYVNQAITAYKAAIAADPRSAVLTEELTDFYIQTNRLSQARSEAEAAVAKNPNDVSAHRMLARIYMQLVRRGQGQQANIDANMLRRATEEFTKVTELDPKDSGALVLLARLQLTGGNVDSAAKNLDKALAIDAMNEDALVVRALIYSEKGDDKNALEMYQRAAEVRPTADSLRRLADAYMKLKEYDLANEAIKRAIAMSPEDAKDLRKALAGNLIRENKYEEAVAALEASATDEPGDPEPWMMIMQIQMQLGDLAKAREAAGKAAAADPENTDVQLSEIALLQAEGKPKEAIKTLQGVLDKTSRRTYTTEQRSARVKQLGQLALLNRVMDQPTEAVTAYREIITLNPEMEADVEADIIDTLRGGKKLADAQKEADASVKKFPMDRNVRIAKATLDADMGRVDAAVADTRKLLDGSDDRRIYITISELYQKGKRWNDAGKALDEAEKLSKEQGEKLDVWFSRGALYERQKNVAQAEAEFRKVLNVVPDHAQALNYLGYMLTDRNVRLNEALGMIQKAVEREPANGAYLDSLGWAYYRLGRYAEAEEQIRRAVDLSPGDPTMQDHYAEALMQQKKIREAVAAWEESLRQWQASAPAEKDDAEINKVRSKLEQARKQLAR